MPARNGFTRMDVDTGWVYDRKVRRLQLHYPDRWPIFWAAYLVLLGEAWSERSRDTTLQDAWMSALPVEPEEAGKVLADVGLLDPDGRIPAHAWGAWFEPAEARITAKVEAGRHGAAVRWQRSGNGQALGDQSVSNAPRHTTPTKPTTPAKERTAREEDINNVHNVPVHDGRHGIECIVCAPLVEEAGGAVSDS